MSGTGKIVREANSTCAAGRPITVVPIRQRAGKRVGHSRSQRPLGPCEAASSRERVDSDCGIAGQRRPRAVPDHVREPLGPTAPGQPPTNPAIARPVEQHMSGTGEIVREAKFLANSFQSGSTGRKAHYRERFNPAVQAGRPITVVLLKQRAATQWPGRRAWKRSGAARIEEALVMSLTVLQLKSNEVIEGLGFSRKVFFSAALFLYG